MKIALHPRAKERLAERGATLSEVMATINEGERFRAKFGRMGFRRNFTFSDKWREATYATKQEEKDQCD